MDSGICRKIAWILCLALMLSAALAFGQGIVTGSISGVLEDQQKARIPGAQVSARNLATNQEFKTASNDVGIFSIRSIPIGSYTVKIELKNFRPLEVANVEVTSGVDNDLGTRVLEIGPTTEVVTVEGTVPLVETTSTQGGTSFQSNAMATLPVAGAFDDLAFFTPGVTTVGSQGFGNTNGESFAVNGQRGRNNNFQIDGQSNNDNSVSGPSIFMGNQDLIAEFSIITNNADVSYGRNSGAVVNYVTKSGTNNFHGTAFEYYTGNWAQSLANEEKNAAWGYCLQGQTSGCDPVTGPPRLVDNRFGGTFGGPVVPDKIWFFTSYMEEHTKSAGGISTSGTSLSPTPAGLAMLNEAFPTSPGVAALNAIGPYSLTTGNPRPIGATVLKTVNYNGVPLLDVPFAPVGRNVAAPYDDYEASGRADFQITSKDLFFARYFFQQNASSGYVTSSYPDGGANGWWQDVPGRSQQIALDWTHTFNVRLVNQVRFSYERLGVFFEGGGHPDCTIGNIHSGCATSVGFTSSYMNLGPATNMPQGRLINNSQWQDNASLVMGKHTFKFGGEYTRQRSPNNFLPNNNGRYIFSNFDAFMAGNVSTLSLTDGPVNRPFKEQDASLYFSDQWRFRDNLTLTMGIRWEYWQQAFNLLSDISIANQLGPNPFWDTSLPLSRTTLAKLPNNFKNFGPSIGFAYTPRIWQKVFGKDQTVIRGGYRIGYDPIYYNLFLNTGTNAPVVNAGTVGPSTAYACTAPCFPTSGFMGVDVRNGHLQDIPTGADPGTRTQVLTTPNFHNPYVQTWTLGIQRSITPKIAAEVRYVGSHTVGEFQTLNGNPSLSGLLAFEAAAPTAPSPIPTGVTSCADPLAPGFAYSRVFCNFGTVQMRANSSWSTYNALQSELRIRNYHGMTAALAYTFSKNMDNASEAFATGAGGQTVAEAQNPFNLNQGERGLSGLDFPHVVSVYFMYDLPWYKNQQGILGHLLGGWSMNTTYRFNVGELWTPRQLRMTGDPLEAGTYCDNPYAVGLGSTVYRCRPFMGNPAAPVDMVGLCTDATRPDCGLIDFNIYDSSSTGVQVPISASQVHWIYNNNIADVFYGTPYGNVRRNPGVRGDPVNTVNFSLGKTAKVSERVNLRFDAQVYNLFNTLYLGVPGTIINYDNAAAGGNFGTRAFNYSGGQDFGAVTNTGLARRTLVVGAKVVF